MASDQLEDALAVLRELEWSGKWPRAPMRMGDPPMGYLRCCPSCRGVDPKDRWKGEARRESVNHRVNCKLHAALYGWSSE